eukprot:600589-Pyramimonas_sp.AAC.1
MDPSSLQEQWVLAATEAMRQHESLALVGMQGLDGSADNGEMEFVIAVSNTRAPPQRIYLSAGPVTGTSHVRGARIYLPPSGLTVAYDNMFCSGEEVGSTAVAAGSPGEPSC